MNWLFEKSSVLPKQQFLLWEKLLEKRTGIQLSPAQHILLQTQISLRMRELGIEAYDHYYEHLQEDMDGIAEWQILVDRLVVKETTFFRHRPSLDLVKHYVEKRLDENPEEENLELWSIGCSTGEEPYALAALTNDCFEQRRIYPYFGVTAMDISLPALAVAKEGVYTHRSLKLLEEHEKYQYFIPCENGRYIIRKKIQKRVCFTQANVLHLKERPEKDMDVIYCQNMLIYFRRWRRRRMLNEMVKRLKPGGLLVIGLGEITDWACDDVERVPNKEVHAYVKRY